MCVCVYVYVFVCMCVRVCVGLCFYSVSKPKRLIVRVLRIQDWLFGRWSGESDSE